MARYYERKYASDGSLNPNWKPEKRVRKRKDTRQRKGNRHKRQAKAGFVAWDSEAIDINGRHTIVLLLSSAGDRAYNPNGLSTEECLECILAGVEREPCKYHVGFAFGYDVNMILGDLDFTTIKYLWKANRTYWNGYDIVYRNRKEFALRRHGTKRYARIWDVFGFFQCSFVEALRQYKIVDPSVIEAMKQRRSSFVLDDMPEIEAYCKDECYYLAQMMERFAEYLDTAEIHLTRYDGAGAIAAGLLRKHSVDKYKAENAPEVIEAARHAYFGGRIELVKFGYADVDAWQYDVRSAYPNAMQYCPCLACGKWKHGKGYSAEPFTLYRVEWDLAGAVCPFPWRNFLGRVYYPPQGEAWIWAPEYDAAVSALHNGIVTGTLKILEHWRYTTNCSHKPFAWIPELYQTRKDWRARGIGAEKVLKLGLNSLYGKTAQRVGGKNGKPPQWHQLEWAGYVTSYTRAMLYTASFDAIKSNALVMYATDAIVSLCPLKLTNGESLGQWEASKWRGVMAVQSGVYWLDEIKAKTRGFGKEELEQNAILDAWKRAEYTLPVSTTRFFGMGRAIASKRQWEHWRSWKPETRLLALSPQGSKRALAPGVDYAGARRMRPELGLLDTVPARVDLFQVHSGRMSTPRALPWVVTPSAGLSAPGSYHPASDDEDERAEADSDDAFV